MPSTACYICTLFVGYNTLLAFYAFDSGYKNLKNKQTLHRGACHVVMSVSHVPVPVAVFQLCVPVACWCRIRIRFRIRSVDEYQLVCCTFALSPFNYTKYIVNMTAECVFTTRVGWRTSMCHAHAKARHVCT